MKLPKVGRWVDMITYDYAVCEICGKHYQSVSSHIRQAHGIRNINEYKDEYGYNRNQPLESGRLQERRSLMCKENGGYENIKEIGKRYQFKKGVEIDRHYNEQHMEGLRYMGKENSKDKKITEKRAKTLSNTIKKRVIRDDKGRFTGYRKK